MPSPDSRWLTATGVFVGLAGLVFHLTRREGQPAQWWHWGLVALGAAMLLIGLLRPRRSQLEQEPRVSFRKLVRHWPAFQAKVGTYAEFFNRGLVFNLAEPLATPEGLDVSKAEDAALNARRETILSAFHFLNRLTYELTRDLEPRPRRLEEARMLVSRFETLVAAPQVLPIEDLLRILSRRSSRSEEFTARLERLAAFKRDYESFARAANQDLGSEFFRRYVP